MAVNYAIKSIDLIDFIYIPEISNSFSTLAMAKRAEKCIRVAVSATRRG